MNDINIDLLCMMEEIFVEDVDLERKLREKLEYEDEMQYMGNDGSSINRSNHSKFK